MTYIEFLDKSPIENIGACLTDTPNQVIYIGNNPKQAEKQAKHYEDFFASLGKTIACRYKCTSKSNLNNAVELLSEIMDTYPDCVFDITGGNEILLVALGMVRAKYADKNIQMRLCLVRNGTIFIYEPNGDMISRPTASLSVQDNIRLYGGSVPIGEIHQSKATYLWDMNDEFVEDIHLMWGVCKDNVRQWNAQISVLDAATQYGTLSEDGLTVTVSRITLDWYISRQNVHAIYNPAIIRPLLQYGLLTCFDCSESGTVTIGFKNLQVKKCLTKAGQALEMKIYAAARAVEEDGAPVYNSAMNGVVIDWDGKRHTGTREQWRDTENEIDVLLMHGLVPVFISCKNGNVETEELYKLQSVANRFGGAYAKKVLVTTALDTESVAGRSFCQRARDMGIRIIDNLLDMDDAELNRTIKSLWLNP